MLPRLRVRFHQTEGFGIAVFSRHPVPLLEPAEDPADLEARPTLYLQGSTYLRDGRWIPLVEQSVDASEYLLNALLLAHLEIQRVQGPTPFATAARRRSEEILREVPPELRLEAYLRAVADFGSHALSAANQLERSARRHRQRGTDLCRHFDRSASLFGLWDRIFKDGLYLARYYEPADGEALTGRWVTTGVAIEPQDKQLLARTVFEGFWQGNRRADLGERYCP